MGKSGRLTFDPNYVRLLRRANVGANDAACMTLERAKAAEKVLPSSWKEARAAMGAERQKKENEMEKQWVVVENGRLIRTFGLDKGSRDAARREAKKRKRLWPGAKAVLLTQDEIDRLD